MLMPKPFPHLLVLGVMLVNLPLSLGQAKSIELTGRVTSESGKPLEGVVVESASVVSGKSKTNNKGEYLLTLSSSVSLPVIYIIRFALPGYKTITKVLAADSLSLDVVLMKGSNTWTPARCRDVPDFKPKTATSNPVNGNYFGNTMNFPITEAIKPIIVTDDDYVAVVINFESQNKSEFMRWGEGPLWSLGMPDAKLLKSAVDVQEREIVFGDKEDAQAVDYQGRDATGHRWRYVGMFAESIGYRDVSDQAAELFDSIIDKMCWDR